MGKVETLQRHVETTRTAGRIPLDITRVELPPHEDPDPVSDNFILCLALRGATTAHFDFGDGWRQADVPPKTFMPITPPDTLGRLMIDRPHRHLIVALPKQAVAEIVGDTEGFGRLHAEPFRDQLVRELCIGLWAEAKCGHAMGDLYADCARATLVLALRRRAKNRLLRREPATSFSPGEWRRVEGTIRDRLGERLTVEMLALPTGMRETRFLRAFKAKTGMTPYRYVLHRRVEAAHAMLADDRLGLAEVALASGFTDQAHMTSTFARLVGRTPGQFRRARH